MVYRKDWDEVRSKEKYIIKEVEPVKLASILENVGVFSQIDYESIAAVCKNHGPTHATQSELLTRIKKRGPESFSKFVAALRQANFDHVAQLLDPTFKVTDLLRNERTDELVVTDGVADIRVQICLLDPSEEQTKNAENFCKDYQSSHSDNTVELRNHFKDLFNESICQHVNLVKTTSSKETPVIIIFRISQLDAAKRFSEDDLKAAIETKLRNFVCKENCFANEDFQFNIVVSPDDLNKVYEVLENRCECQVLVDGMEKLQLTLRDYQEDLVKPALEGKNTIICAATGSGKTFIAMEAIKQHMIRPEHKYVAFIVNTVSLVEQQQTRLQRYLPDSVEVSSVCGSNPDVSLPDILEGYHVIVLTAQVLLNSLKKDKQDGEPGEKEISITKFSLLVFDECHHTTKDHPYNDIMRWYMKEKIETRSPHLPQIIGLSASLGVGTGNNGSGGKAEHYILGLCSNLDIHELKYYTEELGSETNITPIPRDRVTLFQKTINEAMSEIEGSLLSVEKPVHPHGSQPYKTRMVDLRKQNLERDDFSCVEHLTIYNDSLMISQQVRTQDALRYLRENIRLSGLTETEEKLRRIFNESVAVVENCDAEPNPGLEILESRLLEKLDNHQSKGIIFVEKRFVAGALVDWLKTSERLQRVVKNPTFVIGGGQRRGEAGMAKASQDRKIQNFRDGDCNVIVATSVLLEGIDVPKCNFAINYGMPGNEITLVQARGRVRMNVPDDWQYDIIISHEQVMIKEHDIRKEKLMKETIERVTKMNKDEFRKQVEKRQKQDYNEHLKSQKRLSSPRSLVPDDVHFHCIKCGVFACKARHIKIFHNSNYIIPDYENNLQNFKFKVTKDDKYLPGGFNKTGKTYCEKCDQDWGIRAKNVHGEFPLIKISSFRVKRPAGKAPKVYSKWKEFEYQLEKFDLDNDSDEC